MSAARFRVASAGPHVTVQDAGRPGLMRYGVPASGPMDRLAHAAANVALGRSEGAAAIEVSLGGLVLECIDGAVSIAVAGGGFIVHRGDTRTGAWSAGPIRAGERLTIRPGPWGTWTYLAFAGDLKARTWLGHAATHALSNLGGGRLAAGDEITVLDARLTPDRDGAFPCPVLARPDPRAHVVMGPQDHLFDATAIEAVHHAVFRLTGAYDRMGVRLSGPSLGFGAALSIPSEPIVRGAVQVAGDGVATVLLADHQTTGGYPKIATVIADDTDRLAQLRPGSALRFVPITPEAAVEIARQRAARRAVYLGALAGRA